MMNVSKRHASHPDMMRGLDTAGLRRLYLIERIFVPDTLCLVHSQIERMVVGGVAPVSAPVALADCPALGKGPLLASRELGLINVGGPGSVSVDGERHALGLRDGLYVPRGTGKLVFESDSSGNPAKFYLVSTPAHARFETVRISLDQANPMPMGSPATSNERVIYQYVNPDICKSSQLLLGLTMLKEGSVWNTMPSHLHDRRSETYFYFDLKPEARVFHMMGEPAETRHVVVANEQAVISPPWSIHSGVGTSNYSFIWAMGGENQDYKDMDAIAMETLR
jgi:4-deoxy-L-threo-5-hexosulose-uronate ketol-isomerase